MRIGIFSECYRPILNGVVVSIDTFKNELEKMGHKCYIFAPANRLSTEDILNVYRYPALPWPKDYPLAFPYLAPLKMNHILNLNLDIIHTQHMFTMGRLGRKMAHRLHIPLVHTYHTLITEYTHYVPIIPQKLTKAVILNLTKSYCNSCDQVVTPSPSMKKILRSYGVNVAIEAIPTGIYLKDFTNPYHKTVLKEKWRIPEEKKILLYLSRIAREKNLDFLFKAIKKLKQKRQDFHLLMVGGGPELKYYQTKVKQWELDSYVTFTDKQEKDKANRFFGAADIFVFPSITETQGIVITEAMASGVPAVAINKMGPSDIIQDGIDGYLTSLNLDDFCAKIEKLLDNDNLREKFSLAAKKNVKKYTASESATLMEKLYEKTLSHYS